MSPEIERRGRTQRAHPPPITRADYPGPMRSDARFSVIIPTLQRSDGLRGVALQCARHPLVQEVLVINNAPVELGFTHPRLRVLQQETNIFVNPAWNLGASEARGAYLAIVNDDVEFDDEALTYAGRILRRGIFGIVGPDKSTFHDDGARPISHRLARHAAPTRWFGTFMCLRRSDYVPIPDDLRIWGGDDWLIANQRRPPAALIRTRFRTEMSTTTRSAEFQQMFSAEREATERLLAPIRGRKWWHHAQRWHENLRNRLYLATGR